MQYTRHALFRDARGAEAARREIESAGLPAEQYHLTVRRGTLNENDLPPAQSDSFRGLLVGAVAGLLSGAVLGWVLYALAALSLDMAPSIAMGMLAGLVFGGLGGVLYGAGFGAAGLKRLDHRMRRGGVIITAETMGLSSRDAVDAIFKKHGAALA